MAQRQAGIAHIASHAESNWRPIAQTYSDPDVSGSTLERVGLSRLLSDIDAGRIDVVIVQKIDRLTRSMTDFVKLLELFDQHGVALVSVTQHLNSQDATGRLSINTLMSFAQFEREITGERIRDKIKATRRKGLWAGSVPPLGYEVRNQHLLIKKTEADLVRRIFKRFVAIGSITELLKVLKNDEVTTKQWITQTGKIRGGHAIDKTYIYKVLNNRIFLGELHYDDAWHEGIHSPIISIALWDSAQALLQKRRRPRRKSITKNSDVFLFKGLVFGNDERAYSPWLSSMRRGRRYAYYIPQRDVAEGAGASGLPRCPAGELEAVVLERLREKLRDPPSLIENLPTQVKQHPLFEEVAAKDALTEIDAVWELLFPAFVRPLIRQMLKRITIAQDKLTISWDMQGIGNVIINHLKARSNIAVKSGHKRTSRR